MLINLHEYHRPDSLAEASRLLAEFPGKRHALAGGTRLLASSSPSIEEVVDLRNLPLSGIASREMIWFLEAWLPFNSSWIARLPASSPTAFSAGRRVPVRFKNDSQPVHSWRRTCIR